MERETPRDGIQVSREQAKLIADLLRYAVSLNTTVGLVSPERRLTPSTYRTIELAAGVLEGKSFEAAAEESDSSWSGSLEEDHDRALSLLQSTRERLVKDMSRASSPQKSARYLEVERDHVIELIKFPKP